MELRTASTITLALVAAASASASGGDELHSCCPNLEGVDLEICETATDELSCEIWLDIFREEGSC